MLLQWRFVHLLRSVWGILRVDSHYKHVLLWLICWIFQNITLQQAMAYN